MSIPFSPLIVEPEITAARTVLVVAGEVDLATAPQLGAAVEAALASGAPEVCVDLTRTTFMDSSGLHVLVAAARRAEELGHGLRIVCPPGPVDRVIQISGVGELIPRSPVL